MCCEIWLKDDNDTINKGNVIENEWEDTCIYEFSLMRLDNAIVKNCDQGWLIWYEYASVGFNLLQWSDLRFIESESNNDIIIKLDDVKCGSKNENVVFHWELISEVPEEANSLKLLREVIDLWFSIRGFSVANKVFEEYKTASKINIKGKKGIRKTLQ